MEIDSPCYSQSEQMSKARYSTPYRDPFLPILIVNLSDAIPVGGAGRCTAALLSVPDHYCTCVAGRFVCVALSGSVRCGEQLPHVACDLYV